VLDRLLELHLEELELQTVAAEVQASVAAAVAAEAALYERSSSTLLYRNLAAQHFAAAQRKKVDAASASCGLADVDEAGEAATRISPASIAFFVEALAHRHHAVVELLWEKPYFFARGPVQAELPDDEPELLNAPFCPPAPAEELPPLQPLDTEPRVAECVKTAVRACALGFLAATTLPPASIPALADRVCVKVCGRHTGAADASFLAREAARVQALCMAYAAREEKRSSNAATAPTDASGEAGDPS
jgi:hypothetical protein